MQPAKYASLTPEWTIPQQRILAVLAVPENRGKSRREINELAGYKGNGAWYLALRDPHFAARLEELMGRKHKNKSTTAIEDDKRYQRFVEVLAVPENRSKSITEICQLAGYKSRAPWSKAMKNHRFAAYVEQLTGHTPKPRFRSHKDVTLARNPEEELAGDVWDMRRLKATYPKHHTPGGFVLDWTRITNPILREQVKRYFRLHLPQWKAYTFRVKLSRLEPLLAALPPDVHVGTITREHIEALVSHSHQWGQTAANRSWSYFRLMLHFMATNPAWKGPRPPRFLIYPEDIPNRPDTHPRPIPPDVVDQFDAMLEKAVTAMKAGEEPPVLSPMLWDALLILRQTGMRTEDVCHLKTPDANGRNGCLVQDPDGYWWIRIDAENHKMGKEHKIPTRQSDGSIDAIRRQTKRIEGVEDHYGKRLLFRTAEGTLAYREVNAALVKLTGHLTHEGKPYKIAPHQFRHTKATDMIEMGTDIYMVKEFLGHASLQMTQKYIKIFETTLKKAYDQYRTKRPPSFAAVIADNLSQVEVSFGAEEDSGWLEGKVGKLYRSPLPNGLGSCVHLPQLDPCPTPPVCGFCSKLCVEKRHLPLWETALQNHQHTMELLAENPTINDRAIQRHKPYLEKAKQIVETVQREGRYDGRIHNK